MKKTKRLIELSALFGLIVALAASFISFNTKCDELRQNILRLHIIANSDSAADQNIKIAVRDAVLKGTENDFKNCASISGAVKTANSISNKINEIAESVLAENGCGYGCKTAVKKEFFKTRVYDDFTLPAGNYNTVTLKIGEGKGHNWWCIIFPGVCVPAGSKDTFDKTISEQGREITENGSEYIIKFKLAEIFESFKKDIKAKK